MIDLTYFRDLSDINCYIKVIEGCQQLDKQTRWEQLSNYDALNLEMYKNEEILASHYYENSL